MPPSARDSGDLLFVTRKWEGRGGMQRLSRDLWALLRLLYGERARLVPPPAGDSRLRQIAFVPRMLAAVRRSRGCHVHLGDASLVAFAPLLKSLGARRVTVTACGLDVVHPSFLYQSLLQRGLPAVDRFLPISAATAQALREREAGEERIAVCPCGVHPGEEPGVRGATEEIVLVGRLIPRKGAAWFLAEVWPLLRTREGLRCRIVGDGPERGLIRRLIPEDSRVTLETDADDARVRRVLEAASLLVVPNVPVPGDMEGFGIVCLEAAERGTPVAAAQLEGLADAVIPGETGAFFHTLDAEGCARTILALLDHPLPRERVRAAALSAFGWDVLLDRYRHALDA